MTDKKEHLDVPCEDIDCQECCEHSEHDHFICMDCGLELDPGTFIDWAMDRYDTD